MEVRVARVYDPATARDGYRVLVDRLWPRGISKWLHISTNGAARSPVGFIAEW